MTTDGTALLADAVFEILQAHFDLPKGAEMVANGSVRGLEGILLPDYTVRSGTVQYLVQVKHRLNVQDLALALLARESHRRGEGSGTTPSEPVLICKVVPPDLQSLADSVDIHVLRLDWQVPLTGRSREGSTQRARKVTSEKSWRVVYTLLASGPTSIKALARRADLSYGWTHATVAKLMDMGIASRTAEGVTIVDVAKLLNGVAWERPFRELRRMTLRIKAGDAMAAARTVQSILDERHIDHAFTVWTAGDLYTGYLKRGDSVHLYVPRDRWALVREYDTEDEGIDVVMSMPDRDAFSRPERIQGLDLVEPALALLDLAGLGHAAHDLAMEMVMHIGK
jgi:hypothetical protein